MTGKLRYLLLFLLIVPTVSFSGPDSGQSPFRETVLQRVSTQQQNGKLSVAGRTLYAAGTVLRMYKLDGYRPLWDESNTTALFSSIKELKKDGLNPQEYRFAELDTYLSAKAEGRLSTTEHVDLDLLLSEAFVRAIYNLKFGKVDPESLDPDINFIQPFGEENPASLLLESIRKKQVAGIFGRARPENPRYERMRQALARYRQYQESNGWEAIPEGKTLKPGDSDPRVAKLRERLRVTGEFQEKGSDSQLFDEALGAAVERFQKRSGMDVDGAVGPKTLAALNVPVEERINQIRVNLERQRWYLHEVRDEFLMVDIAGFKVYWVKDNKVIWEEIVQVGKEYTNTPVFKDKIRYLEFNPTWTIPPGILRRSILPKLKKDPGYLEKKGYLLLTLEGKPADPKSVDWASLKGFPYIVRQPAGPDNALGLVKFMFPNPHYVFLHDTNHRELFDRTQRTFSSGCIRVHNPFDLATRLLASQDGWDRERIDRVVASEKTSTVHLKKPMRIVIGYFTAVVGTEGVHFRNDIYKRDPAVLRALDGEFRVWKRDL